MAIIKRGSKTFEKRIRPMIHVRSVSFPNGSNYNEEYLKPLYGKELGCDYFRGGRGEGIDLGADFCSQDQVITEVHCNPSYCSKRNINACGMCGIDIIAE